MSTARQSETFRLNIFFWKIFGLWPGKTNQYYKYYSASYLWITLITYDVLLTLNLICTPQKYELLIKEAIFYFTEIAVAAKVMMILVNRDKILAVFEILDCEPFEGDDEIGREIVARNIRKYNYFWKLYNIWCQLSYLVFFVPLFTYFVWESNFELPICKYYFVNDETREKYFMYFFVYQAVGMYGHMTYNINIDSFISGLILMAVTQIKLINHKFNNLKLGPEGLGRAKKLQENIQMAKLNQCLRHYDLILKYCSNVQKIISVTIFVQFGMASIIICIVMCGLLLPLTTYEFLFMVLYVFAMAGQIFLPSWLGTQLSSESNELVTAAYNSEWIPRSKEFKGSITLFVERANTPIVFTGLKLFPLSLGTFTSIIRMAYSLFTLVREVQNH